jgi:hypothetical protein
MPHTTKQPALLKSLYQRLDDKALQPGDEFYEPIYAHEGCEDPVALMHQHIEWSNNESIQMFSGFRGSGKTTELFRLKKGLEAQGYIVLYGDALKYLNPAQEIDITDLLIVLAGTFSDALEKAEIATIGQDSYWERLKNYLVTTKVGLGEIGLQAGADLKLNLETSPTFRQVLREKLANRIGEIKRDVDLFFEDGVKAIRAKYGDKVPGVVFLFDQMEQIRGTLSNEQSVIDSVARLFAQHLKRLEMPYLHMVYTVPPWLKFVLPNAVQIQMLPSIRQWNNDAERSEYKPGRKALRSLVHRRFTDGDFEKFFGGKGPQHDKADKLIDVCGGHFRDLLILLREAVRRTPQLPVTEDAIKSAITAVRGNYLPIAIDDAKWLNEIEHVRDTVLPSTDPASVNRLTRFLDTHFVLYFSNGKEWYDIHPLIRGEVAAIVARDAARKTAAKS